MKTFILRFLLLSLVFASFVDAKTIVFDDLQEYKYFHNRLSYIIKSKQKFIDFDKLKKVNLFNRKRIMSKAIYYKDGTLHTKNITVNFKRAYFLEGVLYMSDCSSKYKSSFIKAKKALYNKKYIVYKGVKLIKKSKIYHKFKYKVKVN